MSRTDFLSFREMAIAGLLEATYYEYLYLGSSIDEAEGLKPSLMSALEDWWDTQHAYADPTVNSQPTRAVDSRSNMSVDRLLNSLPCTPNRRNAMQKRPVRSAGNSQKTLTGASAGGRKRK